MSMDSKKLAVLFLLETSVLGLLSKYDFKLTKEAHEVMNALMGAALEAGLSWEDENDLLQRIQKELNDAGISIGFVLAGGPEDAEFECPSTPH